MKSWIYDKFYKRAQKYIFIGYPYVQKGWKLYDLDRQEVFILKGVVFNEEKFIEFEIDNEDGPIMPLAFEEDDVVDSSSIPKCMDVRSL